MKNLVTSGTAGKITHINYAFGNVQNGQCTIGDAYADYDKAYTADQSVDGVADTWDQPLRGSFNQLRKLKKAYPNIKILWSFGGWTWSGGFPQAAANPTAFAQSCYNLVEDPRWADVFDGIDLDWEYPNACGLSCDTSGPAAFKNLVQAVKTRFGANNLVTAAITADASDGGKIDKADYAGAAQYVDFYNVMTYDFFGAWAAQGPTAPHSPLTSYAGIPQAGFNSADAIAKLKAKGVMRRQAQPRHRLLRPRLDRSDPGGPRRHRHRTRAGHVRAGHRGLQGAQDQLPGHRHDQPARPTPSAAATGGATTPRPRSPGR